MAPALEKPVTDPPVSPGRLWAEQLAAGMALLLAILIFMAFFHPALLSVGGKVLTTNDIAAYGWWAVLGIFLQLLVHEIATVLVAYGQGLPLRFRFFPLGAHATAILEDQPRQTWRDAVVGFAGPVVGGLFSIVLAVIYHLIDNPEDPHFFGTLLLCIACVGYFYNLVTLTPILDLEGGWIAPAIAPQAWLLGLVASVYELTNGFNLALLGVFSFALPRFVLLLRARMPRTDLACTTKQRLMVSIGYFFLVLALAWLGSMTFVELTIAIPRAMSD